MAEAKAIVTDRYYLGFPFKVELNFGDVKIEGGFSSATIPEISFDTSEYRAGDDTQFRRKIQGLPTTNDVTLQSGRIFGVTGRDFQNLLRNALNKSGNYGTVTIYHYHPNGYTKYTLHDAFIMRIKPDGDLDSMASDVSLAEVDIAYRYFTEEEVEDTNIWTQLYGAGI